MLAFHYRNPTEIFFGKNAETQIGSAIKRLGGSKVLIVYGMKSAEASGLIDKVKDCLTQSGIAFIPHGGVRANPALSHVRDGIGKAKSSGVDFILAVGGGSVIDTAKAIAVGAAMPKDIWYYWDHQQDITASVPVGCILTIAASGSETSNAAVITNEETCSKRVLHCELCRPVFAVMNPELTFSLTPHQVACGIVDIMMHTMDRYFTPTKGNQLTDEIAEGLLRVVIRNAQAAVGDTRDYDAMSELMWCGCISHNGLTELGAQRDFATHNLGHELSAGYDVIHGETLSALWGSWAKYVYGKDAGRFARYGEKVWRIVGENEEEKARGAIEATVDFFAKIGMPVSLKELGLNLSEEDIEQIAEKSTIRDTRIIGSFYPIRKKDFIAIYDLANR